jgi:hypothetical protein
MADIQELANKIRAIREAIKTALPDLAIQNTINAKAIIERNIREVGFGAKYSGNKIPAWFFEGKEKSKSGEAFIESVKKKDAKAKEGEEQGMTWAELRRAEGLPTDHVDLSFTNKMWSGLTPLKPYYENGVLYVPLGGTTQETVDKLNYNRDRYGDFMGKVITERELQALRNATLRSIDTIIRENGID